MRKDVVTIEMSRHGEYQTTPAGLDKMIEQYLPASLSKLRYEIVQIQGTDYDVSDLNTVTECLMILAELNGLATN